MTTLIALMNSVVQEWKELWDFTSSVEMKFSEENDLLCLNRKVLCPISDLTILSCVIDDDILGFYFEDLDLEIRFKHPEEKPIRIEKVVLEYSW